MESTRVIMADYIENNNTPNYVSPSSEIVNSTPEPVPTPVPTPVKENDIVSKQERRPMVDALLIFEN